MNVNVSFERIASLKRRTLSKTLTLSRGLWNELKSTLISCNGTNQDTDPSRKDAFEKLKKHIGYDISPRTIFHYVNACTHFKQRPDDGEDDEEDEDDEDDEDDGMRDGNGQYWYFDIASTMFTQFWPQFYY
eukprot:TRINITY_DN2211_c0_g1_i1.p2 TRINITY_DN2211_c0_g1~~TRINITY_DN2211_c0_g1_i1.p2  ORF type:complete len:131 (+),score=19.14 TRINITY_DN2211_c0_g1_i1:803-1195(+)